MKKKILFLTVMALTLPTHAFAEVANHNIVCVLFGSRLDPAGRHVQLPRALFNRFRVISNYGSSSIDHTFREVRTGFRELSREINLADHDWQPIPDDRVSPSVYLWPRKIEKFNAAYVGYNISSEPGGYEVEFIDLSLAQVYNLLQQFGADRLPGIEKAEAPKKRYRFGAFEMVMLDYAANGRRTFLYIPYGEELSRIATKTITLAFRPENNVPSIFEIRMTCAMPPLYWAYGEPDYDSNAHLWKSIFED